MKKNTKSYKNIMLSFHYGEYTSIYVLLVKAGLRNTKSQQSNNKVCPTTKQEDNMQGLNGLHPVTQGSLAL